MDNKCEYISCIFLKCSTFMSTACLGCTDTSLTCRTRIPIRIRYFDTPILLRYRIGKVSENMRKK